MATQTTPIEIEIGKIYRLYGRMGKMKRYSPVSGDHFVVNLIHADIYAVNSDKVIDYMKRELDNLQEQGDFEFRVVGNL